MKHKLHKYQKVKFGLNGHEIFKCILGCKHYLPAINLLLGRESECWRCGKPFVAIVTTITLKKPHCEDCTKGREVMENKDIHDVLDALGIKA